MYISTLFIGLNYNGLQLEVLNYSFVWAFSWAFMVFNFMALTIRPKGEALVVFAFIKAHIADGPGEFVRTLVNLGVIFIL